MKERGQVLIIVAAALVALSGFMAIVVDAGLLYLNRARCTNVAEAAALAGVQALPGDPSQATALALEYVGRNGFPTNQAQIAISQDNTRLDVTVKQTVQFFFARLLGFESVPVAGSAAVQVAALHSLRGAVPLGVERQHFEYGATYYLKNSPGYGGSYRGNFGGLALGGRGAKNYENNLANGYAGELKIGDVVETEPGNMSGPTTRGINARLSADPTGTYENHSPDSPRILKVPVVEWSSQKGGRTTVTVVGFAAFWLEGVGGQGNENYVTGRFMELMTSDGEVGSGGGSGESFGLYGYRIVR